jgi:hypothetical protein
MTDPKELNTIDKLFRDTFSSLPDTPAPDGWDIPSERVWMRIRREIGFPPAATGSNSRWMLAALTVGMVVAGIYWLRSTGSDTPELNNKASEIPTAPRVIAAESSDSDDNSAEVSSGVRSIPLNKGKEETPEAPSGRQTAGEDTGTNRMKGAAPLPGTSRPVAPNTTEERRAALEQLWRTPLEMLPVPRK